MRPEPERRSRSAIRFFLSIAAIAVLLAGCVQRIIDDGGTDGGCDPPCLAELGWAGYEAGRRIDINQFRSAVGIDPAFAEGYVGLGWFNIEFGYIDAAALDFQTALGLDTSLVAAYAGEAYCLAALPNPDYDTAILMAETAIQKGGSDYVFEHNEDVSARSLRLLLATIYFRLRNYSAALAEVDEIEPSNGLNPSSRTFVPDLLLFIVQLAEEA